MRKDKTRAPAPLLTGRRAGLLIILAGLALTALLFWRQDPPPAAMPQAEVVATVAPVTPAPPTPAVIPPAPPAPALPLDPPVALDDLVQELALQAMPAEPAWRRNAAAWTRTPGQPAIAIVIDDLGPAPAATRKAIALPGPLTLAFLPYAENLPAFVQQARAQGHELIVHMPMEPLDMKHNRPGEGALLTGLDAAEIAARLDWALGRVDQVVGINNHMGSAFTRDEAGMSVVMQVLQARGLLFLDSRTIGSTKGEALARRYGVPHAGRDVFLDNDKDSSEAIWAQLRQAERVALKHGQAIAIGHPHAATLAALAAWIPEARAKGFAIVPVSALVREEGPAGQALQ